jgi:hypothetical protein
MNPEELMTRPRLQQRQRRIRNQDHRCPPAFRGKQDQRFGDVSPSGAEMKKVGNPMTADLFETAGKSFFGTKRVTPGPSVSHASPLKPRNDPSQESEQSALSLTWNLDDAIGYELEGSFL